MLLDKPAMIFQAKDLHFPDDYVDDLYQWLIGYFHIFFGILIGIALNLRCILCT
jgi:hypothetical protein